MIDMVGDEGATCDLILLPLQRPLVVAGPVRRRGRITVALHAPVVAPTTDATSPVLDALAHMACKCSLPASAPAQSSLTGSRRASSR